MKLPSKNLILGMIAPSIAWSQSQYDSVKIGKSVFESMGCVVCHSTSPNDTSTKTGPNLYGLFINQPLEIQILVAESGNKQNIIANRAYFENCVRNSMDELAVSRSEPNKGKAYPAVMPSFSNEVISDAHLDSIWNYLRTLADEGQAGPARVMLDKRKKATVQTLLEIPDEIAVSSRPRVFRAPLKGLSARAVYVGLPNGMNYAFDPRFLSLRGIWSGGFLNLQEERNGRAGKPSKMGYNATPLLENEPWMTPLTQAGTLVDFEFKEPDIGDLAAVEKYLGEKKDFLSRLAEIDAEYLGHRLDVDTQQPQFQLRVGKNRFTEAIHVQADGSIEILLEGVFLEPQSFQLGKSEIPNLQVDGGEITDGQWRLPASAESKTYRLNTKLQGTIAPRVDVGGQENWDPQPLITTLSTHGKKPLELPAGYFALSWQAPLDLYRKKQIFEPTGIAVAKDGTIVISTRAAGVWRIRNGAWSLFAEGCFESLGVCIEDDHGDQIVMTQKPELTRIIDSDHDGRADVFDTLCDDYGFHGNYHEYTHGPVRDTSGNYYFNLNLCHENEKASWRAGGKFMGSMGGYRGWACRVTAAGKFEPYANGLRSPAGMAFDPNGRLWYAENQGEYVGSSKVVPLEAGKFYGHISSLVDLPKVTPGSPELQPELWAKKLRKGAVWLPHGRLSNSPGNPTWDLTDGKFGHYSNQMFIGDQTLSTLLRVITESVNGTDQGCVIPFGRGLASGIMRPCFLPNGSLLLGQTGRGWASIGGQQYALQQIIWDGKTKAADLERIRSCREGFEMHFTQPLEDSVSADSLMKSTHIQSWFYTNHAEYGSPEHELRDEALARITISDDRMMAKIEITNFGNENSWLDRIYHITLNDSSKLFSNSSAWNQLEAYYTLRTLTR